MLMIQDMPEFKTKNSRSVVVVGPDDTIEDVVEKMSQSDFHAAVIVKASKVVGIFTERDLLQKVVARKVSLKKKISDVMTSDPKTLLKTDTADQAIELMKQGKFRHIPIVDEKHKLIGVLAQKDLMSLDWGDMIHRTTEHRLVQFFKSSQVYVLMIAVAIYTLLVIALISAP